MYLVRLFLYIETALSYDTSQWHECCTRMWGSTRWCYVSFAVKTVQIVEERSAVVNKKLGLYYNYKKLVSR